MRNHFCFRESLVCRIFQAVFFQLKLRLLNPKWSLAELSVAVDLASSLTAAATHYPEQKQQQDAVARSKVESAMMALCRETRQAARGGIRWHYSHGLGVSKWF
jgi:hypothetical protein